MPLNEFCIHLGEPIQVERGGEILDYGFAEFACPGYRMAYCTEKAKSEKEEKPEFLSWEQIWGINRFPLRPSPGSKAYLSEPHPARSNLLPSKSNESENNSFQNPPDVV